MSDGGQLSLFTVSLKTGKFRDNIITIRTDTPEDLIEALNVVEQGVTRFREIDELLNFTPPESVEGVVKNLANGGITGEVVQTNMGGKVCPHGAMVLKSGTGKTGKPWTAYMCQAPKGQTCNPIWQ